MQVEAEATEDIPEAGDINNDEIAKEGELMVDTLQISVSRFLQYALKTKISDQLMVSSPLCQIFPLFDAEGGEWGAITFHKHQVAYNIMPALAMIMKKEEAEVTQLLCRITEDGTNQVMTDVVTKDRTKF